MKLVFLSYSRIFSFILEPVRTFLEDYFLHFPLMYVYPIQVVPSILFSP